MKQENKVIIQIILHYMWIYRILINSETFLRLILENSHHIEMDWSFCTSTYDRIDQIGYYPSSICVLNVIPASF